MKLYYSRGACSLAPHIVLQQLAIPHEIVSVDLKSKKMGNGGNFLEINPKGQVPTLQLDDGQILTENAVILQYLCDQKPGELLPKYGTFERYKALEWVNYITTELHKGFAPLFRPNTPEEYKAITKTNLAAKFDYLEPKVDKFLLGDKFSVADAYLFTVLSWAPSVKIDIGKWPNLGAYYERVKAVDSVRTALKAEGL